MPSNLKSYKRQAGTNPAANTEVTETVPAGKHWLLVSVSIPCAQGATQTPHPALIIDDGTNVIYEGYGSTAAQAVSTTCVYTWGVGLQLTGQVGTGANIRSLAPLPEGLLLGPGYRVRTSTVGIGANTDFGTPSLFVVEIG